MKLRGLAVALLCSGMLWLPALAQTPSGEKAPGERHRRAAGDKREGGPGRGMGRPDATQQLERLTRELTLTSDQQDKIRKLLTDHQEQMREAMHQRMAENGAKVKEIRKQLEEARTAGDREKARTLEAQMRELMGEQQASAARQKLVADIEVLLTPEQYTVFRTIKDEIFPAGRRASLEEHPELLMKAVDSLKLEADKQQKIEGIIDAWKTQAKASRKVGDREAAKADRSAAKNADRAAAKTGAAEVYKQVMAELTPEQQAKVKAWQPDSGAKREAGGKGEGKREGKREGKAPKKQKRDAGA